MRKMFPFDDVIIQFCPFYPCRVFSAYVKEVDEKPAATVWGKKMTFGNLMAEFSSGGGKLTGPVHASLRSLLGKMDRDDY